MVDVEHGRLRALEHHPLALRHSVVDQPRGVADHRTEPLGIGLVLRANAGEVHLLVNAQSPRNDRFLFHQAIVLGGERLAIQQVCHTDAAAASLVLIARADAARGGADRRRHLLHHAMEGKDHVRAIADG